MKTLTLCIRCHSTQYASDLNADKLCLACVENKAKKAAKKKAKVAAAKKPTAPSNEVPVELAKMLFSF
jgi:hypothetical protein